MRLTLSKLLGSAVVILTLFLGIVPVQAKKTLSDANSALQDVVAPSGLAENSDVSTAAADVVAWIMSAMGLLFFILMVYSGIVWMTARGEEDRITKARETIIAATIGLVITVSAYSVTKLVAERLINANAGPGSLGGVDETTGQKNLGCCIMPVDIYSIDSAIPSVTGAVECQQKAYGVWGKPGNWDAVDTGPLKGNDWEFYPATAYPGADTQLVCSKIAGCWISEVGQANENSCIGQVTKAP